jgi:hypothetical protein
MSTNIEASRRMVREILRDDYVVLSADRLSLEEDLGEGRSRIRVDVRDGKGIVATIEGQGVGMVDSLFNALVARLSGEYPSLKTIEFARFTITAQLDTRTKRAGADAIGEVLLVVRNSDGRDFEFRDASRSISGSAVRAVLAGVEYFVNSERAFITCYRALKDAHDRNRPDLVQSFTSQLAELVKNTSYTEVIEQIRREMA